MRLAWGTRLATSIQSFMASATSPWVKVRSSSSINAWTGTLDQEPSWYVTSKQMAPVSWHLGWERDTQTWSLGSSDWVIWDSTWSAAWHRVIRRLDIVSIFFWTRHFGLYKLKAQGKNFQFFLGQNCHSFLGLLPISPLDHIALVHYQKKKACGSFHTPPTPSYHPISLLISVLTPQTPRTPSPPAAGSQPARSTQPFPRLRAPSTGPPARGRCLGASASHLPPGSPGELP